MYRPVPSAPRESGSCVRMRALDPSEAHSSVPWEGVAWKESEQVGPRGWGMVLLPFRRGGYRGAVHGISDRGRGQRRGKSFFLRKTP